MNVCLLLHCPCGHYSKADASSEIQKKFQLVSLGAAKGRQILFKLFTFIKAVSDSLFGMINAVYHDKTLIFIGATFREKLVSHHQAVNEADSCLHKRYVSWKTVAWTKELHFIGCCGSRKAGCRSLVSEQQKCRLLSAKIGHHLRYLSKEISGIVYEIWLIGSEQNGHFLWLICFSSFCILGLTSSIKWT